MNPRTMVLGGLVLAGLALAVSAKQNASSGKVYASPQAVFTAAFTAQAKGEYRDLLGCFTLETQKAMATDSAVVALSMTWTAADDKTGKFKERIKPILDVIARHGLTEQALKDIKPAAGRKKVEEALIGLIKDPVAFAADFMTATEKAGFTRRETGGPEPALADVQIDGDKARGAVVLKQGKEEMKRPMQFARVAGGWKILLPEEKPAPKANGGK